MESPKNLRHAKKEISRRFFIFGTIAGIAAAATALLHPEKNTQPLHPSSQTEPIPFSSNAVLDNISTALPAFQTPRDDPSLHISDASLAEAVRILRAIEKGDPMDKQSVQAAARSDNGLLQFAGNCAIAHCSNLDPEIRSKLLATASHRLLQRNAGDIVDTTRGTFGFILQRAGIPYTDDLSQNLLNNISDEEVIMITQSINALSPHAKSDALVWGLLVELTQDASTPIAKEAKIALAKADAHQLVASLPNDPSLFPLIAQYSDVDTATGVLRNAFQTANEADKRVIVKHLEAINPSVVLQDQQMLQYVNVAPESSMFTPVTSTSE